MTNPFKTEAELCAAFLACVPATWQAYPETCGFDIVLAHKETGAQIGIEAKLTLNAKVLVQVTDNREHTGVGPDYRAVLVGRVVAENAVLAGRLGVKVLTLVPRVDKIHRFSRVAPRGYPETDWVVNRGGDWLPEISDYKAHRGLSWWDSNTWEDQAPVSRLSLPEYVPQVAAGVPSPMKLTPWMIQAIKLCIVVDRMGCVSRQHFQDLKVSHSRWTQGTGWLERTSTRGVWAKGPRFPGPSFKAQHPVSWAEIEHDWPIWGAKLHPVETQQALPMG